jgi:carbohydrate esterase family 8 protein
VKNIIPEGWSSIGAKTAKMYEYNTCDMVTGNPVDVSKRHPYSRQLIKDRDTELINNYRNPAFVLKGWLPDSYMNEIK